MVRAKMTAERINLYNCTLNSDNVEGFLLLFAINWKFHERVSSI